MQSVEDVITAFESSQKQSTPACQTRINLPQFDILESITANLNCGVALLDANLTYLFIGYAVYEMTGLTPDDIRPGATLQDMQALLTQKSQTPAGTINSSSFVTTPGTTMEPSEAVQVIKLSPDRHLRLTLKTLPNGRILSQFEDVTELAAKDAILEKSLSLGNAGIWTYDFETTAYHFSKTISDLFSGKETERLKKHGILGLVHPQDHERYRMALRNISRTGDRFRITTRRTRQPQMWVETTAQLLRNRQGIPISIRAFDRDVTKDLMREKALEAAKDEAIAATSAKSDFLAGMSHEIRTPMNGVLGMAELLAETELTEKQREYLNVINNSSHSLLTIINDILDFSKIEAGAMKLDPTPFNLRNAIDDVMALLATKARTKGLELIVDYAPDLQRDFYGDVGRIRQVITNLIDNAIKFTDTGMIVLTVRTQIGADRQCALTVSVKDTGIGISKTKIEHIFEKFTQASNTTSRRYGGTGLGLTICRHILELMQGRIRVESRPGHGAEFIFDVKLPLRNQAQDLSAAPCRLPKLKALLVDDVDINLKVLTERLSLWEVDTAQAGNAEDAMALLIGAMDDDKPFDVVITDNIMPNTSGLELAALIKSSSIIPSTPIIMMSSCDASASADEMRAVGISSFLIKPVREKRLFDTLQRTMATVHKTKPKETAAQQSHASKQQDDFDLSASVQATLDDITNVLADASLASASKAQIQPPTEQLTAANPEKAPIAEEPAQKARKSVLVAEDFPLNRDVVRLMLADSLYDLHFAANGKIAFEMYTATPTDFDLILMDISMPVMDGFEASELIKSHQATNNLPEIPIIALTGHALKNDREKCLYTGMDDYLTKPIKQDLLIQTLKKWSEGPSECLSETG